MATRALEARRGAESKVGRIDPSTSRYVHSVTTSIPVLLRASKAPAKN